MLNFNHGESLYSKRTINKECPFAWLLLVTYPHDVIFFIANTRYSSFNWNTKKFMWSEQETKILKDLWKKGLTASQISARIPGKDS